MNTNGQLGVGDLISKKIPTKCTGIEFPVISIACGDVFSWIISSTSLVLLGYGNQFPKIIDTSSLEGDAISVTARHGTMALLTSAGKVYSYTKDSLYVSQPDDIISEKLTTLATGETHVIALNSSGEVFTWGDNYTNKLGRPTDSHSRVEDFPTPGKLVCAGSNHSFVLV